MPSPWRNERYFVPTNCCQAPGCARSIGSESVRGSMRSLSAPRLLPGDHEEILTERPMPPGLTLGQTRPEEGSDWPTPTMWPGLVGSTRRATV
jgi:hypothetical protein